MIYLSVFLLLVLFINIKPLIKALSILVLAFYVLQGDHQLLAAVYHWINLAIAWLKQLFF